MSNHVGELIRALRGGVGTSSRADFIRELIERASADKAKGNAPTEDQLRHLEELLEKPGATDGFSPEVRRSLEGFVRPTAPLAPVETLLPDLQRLGDPRELPARFAADFVLLREQLVDRAGLAGAERADRAFEFFARYAERFVELLESQKAQARTPQPFPPVGQAERAELVKDFVKQLETLGFGALREVRTGKDALQLAREILLAATVREAERRAGFKVFEAPSWDAPRTYAPDAPTVSSAAEQAAAPSGLSANVPVQDLGQSANARDRRPEVDSTAVRAEQVRSQLDGTRALPRQPDLVRRDDVSTDWRRLFGRARDKVLGPNMLWNWLHRFRSGAEEDGEARERDDIDKIAFGAAMFLIGVAVIVIVVVSL